MMIVVGCILICFFIIALLAERAPEYEELKDGTWIPVEKVTKREGKKYDLRIYGIPSSNYSRKTLFFDLQKHLFAFKYFLRNIF